MAYTSDIRNHFPIFRHHPDLTYLDSAATTLKPETVIDAEREYLERYSTNVGRGLYPLAEKATDTFEMTRQKTAAFIGARNEKEVIFTDGATASLNLAARLLESLVTPKDNILATVLEHHSNFLPWKELATRTGAEFRVAPIDTDECVDRDALVDMTDEHTKIVAFSAVSNVIGGINPVSEIVKRIKEKNPHAVVVVDAAQAIGHQPIDVSLWNADFVAFSAHKAFGPTGVGVLFGKEALLETLPPVSFGGGMVLESCAETPKYREIPFRFEAGTPNIGGVIAWGAAIDFMKNIGVENIRAHEETLTKYALEKLSGAFGKTIRLIGPKDAKKRSGIIAFAIHGMHPHDIAHLLGESNICVRAGEHCAAPLHRALNLDATTRLSFSVYNSKEDIDRLIKRLKEIRKIL
ncbi:MAG: SufS family cysteine desulfurase [Candidatus Moranbacteria bacterium]|nr:SufS family cysteine desulfurase [Candidatus Moranbacteria bacterium]